FGVRRVAEQEIDADAAELRQPPDVRADAVHRRVIQLPVAGCEDAARRALQQDGHRVWNGVRDTHELDAERPDLDRAGLGPRLPQPGGLKWAVLVKSRRSEAERQARAPDLRDANFSEQVWQRTDVILVGVREDHRVNTVSPFGQIAEVREDQVDAEMLVAGEREAGVENDDLVAELEGGHVLADLPDTAQRDDAQGLGSNDDTLVGGAGTASSGGRRPVVALNWPPGRGVEALMRKRAGALRGAPGRRGSGSSPPPWPRRAAVAGRRPRGRGGSAPP